MDLPPSRSLGIEQISSSADRAFITEQLGDHNAAFLAERIFCQPRLIAREA